MTSKFKQLKNIPLVKTPESLSHVPRYDALSNFFHLLFFLFLFSAIIGYSIPIVYDFLALHTFYMGWFFHVIGLYYKVMNTLMSEVFYEPRGRLSNSHISFVISIVLQSQNHYDRSDVKITVFSYWNTALLEAQLRCYFSSIHERSLFILI